MWSPPRRNFQDYPLRLLALLAFSAGISLLLFNLYLWWRFHVHLPMHDTAHALPLVQTALEQGFWSTTLADWLALHANGHRIAITRLLMLVDYRYFGGQNHVIFASAWASMAVMLAVYAGAFRQGYRAEGRLLLFVVGLVLVFLSSPTQFWNTVNPINGSWYVVFAASALAVWLIANKPTTPTFWIFLAAYLLAIVAAFSNFAGVIVWLLLPALIALRSTRAGLCAALLSGLFVWLYLHDVSPALVVPQDSSGWETAKTDNLEPSSSVTDSLPRLGLIITQTLAYLGSPLSIEKPRLARFLVIISILSVALMWVTLAAQRLRGIYCHNVWLELTLTMATLCLGVAIAAQLGRVAHPEPTAERYQTIVMVYWLSVCGLALFLALQASKRIIAWQLIATTLCLVVATLLLTSSSGAINRSVRDAGRANAIEVLGQLGISEKFFNRRILNMNSRDYLSEYSAFFVRNKVAYKAASMRHIELETAHPCEHVKLAIKPSRWPGIHIATGTVDDHWSKWYRRIPVTTERGEIIGYLYPLYNHVLTVGHFLLQRESKWEGYFRAAADSARVFYLHYRSPPFAKLSCRISSRN